MRNLYPMVASCCLKTLTTILLCFPFISNAQESMRANLYVVDANGATLVDGNLTNYNNIYSNAVDINDAWKMANPGINFGIEREATDLVVERRSLIAAADTTYFRMWNLPQYNYRIRFVLKNLNHPGLKATLKDNYLNTEAHIALNDTTYFDFSVDANPASVAQMRFQLIFGLSSSITPVDVNFTSIKAQRRSKDILVEWGVAGEIAMSSYVVEHSTDGRNFQDIQQVAPLNTSAAKTYMYNDANVSEGDHFYRIKGISIGGKLQYTAIAKIAATSNSFDVNIYPNPVIGKTVQLSFNSTVPGKYQLTLISNNGTRQSLSSLQLQEGFNGSAVKIPANTSAGIYRLEITGPGELKTTKTILVVE